MINKPIEQPAQLWQGARFDGALHELTGIEYIDAMKTQPDNRTPGERSLDHTHDMIAAVRGTSQPAPVQKDAQILADAINTGLRRSIGLLQTDAQVLATAIAEAATRAGITDSSEHGFTGPQLLMLLNDLTEMALASTPPAQQKQECNEAAAEDSGLDLAPAISRPRQ